jgi:hypothetical protein
MSSSSVQRSTATEPPHTVGCSPGGAFSFPATETKSQLVHHEARYVLLFSHSATKLANTLTDQSAAVEQK